ncbi:PAS domain S-box protein [Tichowtungia aerotolerans]|uniref:Sensory/regulatory protein RpfC n=1 Tax=Tichowtungia aerotolerans TaxID=2697043 RepID=A0A6P1M2T9_9BACT|nr:PAS domain S-box protein [Tichowtungia aerotolerans]QHI68151.1 PAS domain S-box protein [Tichowtungia aerotolerans]
MQARFLSIRSVFLAAVLAAGVGCAFELTPQEKSCLEARNYTLRVAFHGNYIPLSYVDEQGDLTGVMPEFFRWMADRVGFELETDVVTGLQAMQGLRDGKYDAVGAAVLGSQRRDQQKMVSLPVLETPTGIFVPENSPVQNLSGLFGKTVACEGESSGRVLDQLNLNLSKKEYTHFGDVLAAVESGECSAMLYNRLTVLSYVHAGKTTDAFRMLDGPLSTNQVCVKVADEALLSLMNRLIAESRQAGVIRWIKRPFVGENFMPDSVLMKYGRWLVGGVAGLLLVVLGFWLWDVRLSRSVHEKTEQLRNSEERLRAIFQNSPDPMFIEDENGMILDANPQACQMQGMAYDELIGKNVLSLVPEDHRESLEKDFPKWFTGELRRYEGATLRSDGSTVSVEVIGAPMRYDGRLAVLLQVRDMSERKRAEIALKESEARYRSLIEVQNSLIVRMDPEGRFTFVNEAFCRFVGRSRGELIGRFFLPYTYHEDLEQPKQALADLVSGARSVVITEHRVRSNNGIAWINWEQTAIFNESGRVVEVQAVGRDVTERRRIHDALQESEKRLRFLFEEIPHIAVQGYNSNHEVIFWNRASEHLYNYSRSEALGKKIEDLLAPDDQREEFVESIDQWVTVGQSKGTGEMIKKRADGEPVAVYSTRLATWNKSGEREMYVVDIDLSELKRANSELVKAKQFAERANRAKSEFLANMSHEIRTPMNGVMGMTSLLLDSGLDDEQKDLAQTVLDSTKELLTIIDELLDISRIEAGEVRLQMEPFCPRETVEKVVALFADRAAGKNVDLSVAIHPDVPAKMMGDAGRIRQVLINLVGNALKFTDDGHIQIRMQVERPEKGWNLLVDVKDTGIGMGPNLQKRVFDKFTQGDSSSTRLHGGAGLGLAITKQLVELMGGRISVSSAIGQGTTFAFNILLSDLAEEEPEPCADVPVEASLQKIDATVLLVDDNLVNQKVAVAMIKKTGCRVSVAANGAEALKVIAAQRFDLIFMDCQMPIMDGFETTRTIRSMVGEIRDIPIIAMTAHALKEDRQKCLDAGMDDYLSKPVHKDQLRAVLQKYCG